MGMDEFVRENVPDDGVVGSYIILAEVLTEDEVELHIVVDKGIKPWTLLGMLQYAYESQLEALHDAGALDDEVFDTDFEGDVDGDGFAI